MGDKSSFKESLEKVMPFIAIGIFMMLIILAVLLYREQTLKKEISENCGWGEDDYFCYCEQSEAMEVKNKAQMTGLKPLDFNELEVEDAALAG